MIYPSKSKFTLNYYINHSSVYPNLTRDGEPEYQDKSEILDRDGTYFFAKNGVGVLFFLRDGFYYGDIYALPKKRGRNAREVCLLALDYMFRVVGVNQILAEVPDFNRASQFFVSQIGFERVGVSPNKWQKNGQLFDVILYKMERKWAQY